MMIKEKTGKMRTAILIIVVVFAITSMVLVSGCIENPIKTTGDLAGAVDNMTTDISGLSNDLEDIDTSIG